MTVVIVIGLEQVDVDHEQGQLVAITGLQHPPPFEMLLEGRAVGDPGQAVQHERTLQLGIGPLEFLLGPPPGRHLGLQLAGAPGHDLLEVRGVLLERLAAEHRLERPAEVHVQHLTDRDQAA